jgi:membrane dipeptidase
MSLSKPRNSEEKRQQEIRARTKKILNFSESEEERGLALHQESIVIDSLFPGSGVMPYSNRIVKSLETMLEESKPYGDIINEIDRLAHIDIVESQEIREGYLQSWKRSGVTCANRALWPPGEPGFRGALKNLSLSKNKIDRFDEISLALSADDIRRTKKEGRHAIIWSLLNTTVLGGGFDVSEELNNVDLFYGLGVRAMELTFNYRNFVGDGCMERYESGLSHYGVKVVERMNNLRMLVDVSHSGYQTTIDAVDLSKYPVAASHTTCRSIKDHVRGKTDGEMMTIAEKGGYIGICQTTPYLGGKRTLKEFLDHVEYAVELVGIDHVGIGTNNRYRPFNPSKTNTLVKQMWQSPDSGIDWWLGRRAPISTTNIDETQTGSLTWINWPYFTVGLVTRGYSDDEIQKIIGGNFLRIIEETIG